VDIEDSTVEFLEYLLRGRRVLVGERVCIGGNAVHDDHDRCIALKFVERAGEVYGERLVGFVRLREGKGSSIG